MRGLKVSLMAVGVALVVCLAGCSAEPESLFTAEQAQDALITNDELLEMGAIPGNNGPTRTTTAAYVSANPVDQAVEPAECRDKILPIARVGADAQSQDVYISTEPFALDGSRGGQAVRILRSVEDAKTLLSDLRDLASSCSSFRIASELGATEVAGSVGGLPFSGDGFTFDFSMNVPGREPSEQVEHVLRFGNVVATINGPRASLEPYARTLSERFAGKFSESSGKVNQSAALACQAFIEATGPYDSQMVSDAVLGEPEQLQTYVNSAGPALDDVTNEAVATAATAFVVTLQQVLDLPADARNTQAGQDSLDAVNRTVSDLQVTDPACASGLQTPTED